jgi:PhnB protein
MIQMNPYLEFNGECEAAFKFYEKCLGGEIKGMIPFEGSPAEAQMPEADRKQILHACLMVNGQALMGADCPGNMYSVPKGFSVSLNFKDTAEAERVFNALSENGTIKMPLSKTFWASSFGMFTDQFGIPWMVNCE